ncbi:hypothetical protein CR513_30658, partial [Mucuna pruriens]
QPGAAFAWIPQHSSYGHGDIGVVDVCRATVEGMVVECAGGVQVECSSPSHSPLSLKTPIGKPSHNKISRYKNEGSSNSIGTNYKTKVL